mmetsp:Transcript_16848/g.52322  ORF Transcript_16848/g.52322 Transcript_16848/m.52322 type:complete len:80 (+) Transcript_16848:39-278(+)|eukprot:CAMPEP_0174849858 /NCGR_PEP_ID=MMETSP1114-20130205/17788_1 /TAXON_ID=312471 /ORGANISM="Neobodo designis, Strain CCAP 1951/1" /LENGTH=79 /DNA_ID=CAMNT_0016084267 /DNA_START=42 /DNA_END=281 /DNA_ORIENTATION=+
MAQPKVLEDFDWRTSVVVACDTLDDAGALPLCRLTLRTNDGNLHRFELTGEQLDDVIETLSTVERAVAAEAERQQGEAA